MFGPTNNYTLESLKLNCNNLEWTNTFYAFVNFWRSHFIVMLFFYSYMLLLFVLKILITVRQKYFNAAVLLMNIRHSLL